MVAAGIGPQNWREPETVALPDDFLPAYPTLVRQLVWRRGHRQPAEALQFLNPLEFRLPPPGTYTSLAVAADRVDVAINTQEQIWVWGDFDADGQTSTAVLVGALRKLGTRVSYFIPNRLTESHGLKAPQLDSIVEAGCRVLITCDCGTNDAAVVDYANSKGLDVIITDHHQQTGPIPRAVAVCNSSHFSPADPLNGAPGVAMAYLLVRELFERRSRGQDVQQELDLVALGIIADLAPGSPANRAFLARGLPRLWREPRPGVRALLKLIGVPSETLETLKISFKLAPLLNAAGRLADAR
ncbi:MAG: single-stranded-DNA-specific exonuclease, partial [Chloroflexi bacterium]|nr:single-stranded-DNA-specific exonuclease [Chloroflexota bacterium]